MRVLALLLTACTASSVTETATDGPTLAPDGASVGTSSLGIYASGSRLKMRVLASADGAKAFLGWHDAQRHEDCVFLTAGDGQQRCLPVGASASVVYFSDVACTQRLALDARACPDAPPSYGAVFDQRAACPSPRYALWSIGAKYTGDTYLSDVGGCAKAAPIAGTLWTVTAEVPPSSFQAASEQIVD